MGAKPSLKHSIDRVNNDGSYTCGKCDDCVAKGAPMNCRWADAKTQQRNTRKNTLLTFRGERLCVAEWCDRLNLNTKMVRSRLRRGWSVEAALTTRSRKRCAQ